MNQLRQAINKIEVVGILAEKDLSVKEFNGKEAITGKLVIKTDKDNFITLKVFTSKLKSDGTESKAYLGLNTVMNEYKSIADTGNEETADKVRAVGQLKEEKPFENKTTGDVITSVTNQLSFISRVTGNQLENFTPQAKWEGEVFVQSYRSEMKKDGEDLAETGRKIMEAVVPAYGGKAFPIKLILEEEASEWFGDNVPKTSTILVYCDFINKIEKTKARNSSGGFGVKTPKVFDKTIKEIVIVGAEEPYDADNEDENSKVFDPQAITQALAIREQAIEEVKNAKPTTTQSTNKGGFGNRNSTSTAKATIEDLDDELPF